MIAVSQGVYVATFVVVVFGIPGVKRVEGVAVVVGGAVIHTFQQDKTGAVITNS